MKSLFKKTATLITEKSQKVVFSKVGLKNNAYIKKLTYTSVITTPI